MLLQKPLNFQETVNKYQILFLLTGPVTPESNFIKRKEAKESKGTWVSVVSFSAKWREKPAKSALRVQFYPENPKLEVFLLLKSQATAEFLDFQQEFVSCVTVTSP